MSDQNSDPSRPFDPPVPPTEPPTAPPAPPEAPPAPPAPPAPDRPAVPKYGEYAPVNPYGVPGYAATATPAATAAQPVTPAPYDLSTPPGYAPAYGPLPKKRRTWDVVLTAILLVFGLFGMGLGLLYAWIFANPELLSQTMSQAGYGMFTSSVGAAPTIIVVSHVALYLLALGLSIPLLIRGRIVVFWIPLSAGVIAAVIFWVTFGSLLLSDPGFTSRVGG